MGDPQLFQGLLDNLAAVVGEPIARAFLLLVVLAISSAALYLFFHYWSLMLRPILRAPIWRPFAEGIAHLPISKLPGVHLSNPIFRLTLQGTFGLGVGILTLWFVGFPLSWLPSVGVVLMAVWAMLTVPIGQPNQLRVLETELETEQI